MKVKISCEYNDKGFLFHLNDYPGAYLRGESENEALAKLPGEIRSYQHWLGETLLSREEPELEITDRIMSPCEVHEGRSAALIAADRKGLTPTEYQHLKLLVLRSARDLRKMYDAIPNPDISGKPARFCYYGRAPRTPRELLERVNSLTAEVLAPFGFFPEPVPDVYGNRMQALSELEDLPNFLSGQIYTGQDGEAWTLQKALRRFLWMDRLYGKALWRTAAALWGSDIPNPFHFL